jgi:hypothetical protein
MNNPIEIFCRLKKNQISILQLKYQEFLFLSKYILYLTLYLNLACRHFEVAHRSLILYIYIYIYIYLF